MVDRRPFGVPVGRAVGLWCAALALSRRSYAGSRRARAGADETRAALHGTTGFRHTDGINDGRPVVQSALRDGRLHGGLGGLRQQRGGATNCDNADKNPRIFTDANLAKYDAIVLLNSSAGPPGPLWSDAQKAAIIKYVQNGGGIAGVHNATDMGTTAETWNWWDGNNANSVVGATMPATPPPARRTSARSRSPTRTTWPPVACRTSTGSATSTTTSAATSAARTTCWRRSTSARTRRAATPWARTTRSRVRALRRRQRQRQHGHGQVLQRRPHVGHVDGPLRLLLHRERRHQQPGQADRRRRPLGRGRGQEVRLLGHGLVLVHPSGARRRREQPDRHRRRQGRQGLLVGDRQHDPATSRRASSRCTTRPRRPATRRRSRRS